MNLKIRSLILFFFQAAAILQVSFLRYWINEKYAKKCFKNGLKSLIHAAKKFKIFQKQELEKSETGK
jgi:hypothetical protein